MKRRIFFDIISGLIIFLSTAAFTYPGYQITELESNSSSIHFTIIFDSTKIIKKRINDQWYADISINGCSYTGIAGLPKLPVTDMILGIPPTGLPRLKIKSIDYITKSSLIPLNVPGTSDSLVRNEGNSWYPGEFIKMHQPGFARSQRIIKLGINPIRYQQRDGLLQIVRSIQVQIDFEKQENSTVQYVPSAIESEPYDHFFKKKLANYTEAKQWRVKPQATPSLYKQNQYLSSPFRYKLIVQEDGVYGITGEQLVSAGADITTIDPPTLAIHNQGIPLPIIVEGGHDGSFDPKDRILFIGRHNRGDHTYYSWYSDSNVYWLTWGNGVGARFAQVPASLDDEPVDTLNYALEQIHLEKDLRYERLIQVPREDIDHWYWTQMNKYDASKGLAQEQEYDYMVDLREPKPEKQFELRIKLFGQTSIAGANPDHHVNIRLNDIKIGDAFWDGKNEYCFEKTLSGTLKDGENKITFFLPGDLDGVNVDAVLLNWIDLKYHKRLIAKNNFVSFKTNMDRHAVFHLEKFSTQDLYILSSSGKHFTNYKSVRENTGYSIYFKSRSTGLMEYFVFSPEQVKSVIDIEKDSSSDLKNMSNSADYIIITHNDFMEEAQRLANHRSQYNLRTKVVDVQDVYDEFNYGIYDPRSIRSFLQYTFQKWVKPAPLFVLLLGDTTHKMDKKIARQHNNKSYIPSMMEYTRSWGMTSSDNYFVSIIGDDALPDMYIGRLPAGSIEEAQIMVQKTIDYDMNTIVDQWRRNICLVSGSDKGLEEMSNDLYREYVPKRMVANFLNTSTNSPHFGTTEDLAEFFNQGQTILTFLGHGGGGVWIDTDLFLIKDIALLQNQYKYPVIFSITCFVGHFDNPSQPSLGEELLKAQNKGIVGHFGSAGRAYIGYYDNMHESLFDAIFNLNARYLGEITTLGKYNSQRQGAGYWDHMKNYILMGDPATSLTLAKDNIDLELSQDQLSVGDKLHVSGKVKGQQTGELLLSAYNDDHSEIVSKNVTIDKGSFETTLFEMTEDTRKKWDGLWGKGIVRAYFKHEDNDGASADVFTVNQPIQVMTDPDDPSHLVPVYVLLNIPDRVIQSLGGVERVKLEWSTNKLNWLTIPMDEESNSIWKSKVPIYRQGGSIVFYKYTIQGQDTLAIKSDIRQYYVKRMPDLYVDYQSVNVKGSHELQLLFTVKNVGEITSDPFSVSVFKGLTLEEEKLLGTCKLEEGLGAKSDSVLYLTLSEDISGFTEFTFQVDSKNNVDESNENNNITNNMKNIVTTTHGSGDFLYSADSSFAVQISPDGVSANTSLVLQRMTDPKYSNAANESQIIPIQLRHTLNWFSCGYVLADTAANVIKEIPVKVHFNITDSTTQYFLNENALRIYAWNDETQTWNGLDSEINAKEQSVSALLPAEYHAFALFASTDVDPPIIQIGIKGQNFADGDMISTNPTFTVVIEDESGFDIGQIPVNIALNDINVSDREFKLYQELGTKQKMTVTYVAEFLPGEYSLTVQATDINGNKGEQKVEFVVMGEFDLLSIANHPNPFVDETIIAFNLTQVADKVSMGIYTVSGRLIRSIELNEVAGYYEYDWDGTDENGNPVANGVYYLKFVAENEDKKIETIEKMAKLE